MKKVTISAAGLRALAQKLILAVAVVATFFASSLSLALPASAYPIFAQGAYENPREATGRIVCANCHLAKKPTEVEVPQAVLPDTVFEAIAKLPYDHSVQQVGGDGTKSGLNIGAVVVLPDGFTLAPEDRMTEEQKAIVNETYIQPYSESKPNILVVGPLSGDQYDELVFPVLSPDPATDSSVHFGKNLIYVGGNRGRGQVYPTGDKSNNAVYNASIAGTIAAITPGDDGGSVVKIEGENGKVAEDAIPAGPEVLVAVGDEVTAGQAITNNPNVGGFGQADAEIVLQSPNRVAGLLAFFAITTAAQILLVLKKKQVERVQAVEMKF
jgi:apocytochrome f